jgi:DNA-binding NtrC family response regulator
MKGSFTNHPQWHASCFIKSAFLLGDTLDLYLKLRTMRIMLVEDDPWIRDALCLAFRNEGCHLVAFDNATEAVEAVKREQFDIIISDYWLPDMDGLSFLRLAGNHRPEVVKIIITAYPTSQVNYEISMMGIHDFIQKPFTIETMERSLAKFVKGDGQNPVGSRCEDAPGKW